MNITCPELEIEMSTFADYSLLLINVFIMCIYESHRVILTASRVKSKSLLCYSSWINDVTLKDYGTTILSAVTTHGDSHICVRSYSDLTLGEPYLLTVSVTKYNETLCNCFITCLCINVLYKFYIPTYSSSSSPCTVWYKTFAVYVQTCPVKHPLALTMFSYTPDGG